MDWRALGSFFGAAAVAALVWWIGSGTLFREQRLNAMSAAELEAEASRAPGDPLVMDRLGMAELRLGDRERAVAALHSAVGLSPRRPELQVHLGQALAAAGQFVQAEAAYREARRLDPKNGEAAFSLGRLYYDNGLSSRAVPELEAATRLRPRDAFAWFTLAHAYGDLRKRDLVLSAMEKTVQLDARQPEAWRSLGRAYWRYGRLPEAESALKRAEELNPKDAYTKLWLGQVYAQKPSGGGTRDAAIEAFVAALALQPRLAEGHLQLGKLLAQQPGSARNAERELRAAAQLDPVNEQPCYELSRLLEREGRTAEAGRLAARFQKLGAARRQAGELEAQIIQEPERPDLRLKLARLYQEYGVSSGAVRQYQAYLSLKPGDTVAAAELAELRHSLSPSDSSEEGLGGVGGSGGELPVRVGPAGAPP